MGERLGEQGDFFSLSHLRNSWSRIPNVVNVTEVTDSDLNLSTLVESCECEGEMEPRSLST